MNLFVARRGLVTPWDTQIATQAGDHEMIALVKAVIASESEWTPVAINPSDPSYGLMQILPSTARQYESVTPDDLLDPETNLRIGITHLRSLTARYGRTSDAIAAYNAGVPRKDDQGRYVNSVGNPMVQRYVDRVQDYWVWYVNHLPSQIETIESASETGGADVLTAWGTPTDLAVGAGGLLVLGLGLLAVFSLSRS